ncbi:MAG: flagellar basal body P-ring protein FlgI [Pseudomonadales bacterium]|nr:flagellar basal body P-ring protein FlgI [Pseudomonadales bacterium]
MLLLLLVLSGSKPALAERLGDLTDVVGVRDNMLIGYGLVVGLDGTGDQTTQAPFTIQSLTNMLAQLGITVPTGTNMQLRNIAAVMVTARLPPFSRPGQRLDVVVSSIGNARSLRGGTLLMSPLKGSDGEIYALAQGNLLMGGASAEGGGSSVLINQLSGARIPGGALVEREVPFQLDASSLALQLKEADFSTARLVVAAINREFDANVASALDGRVISLMGPTEPNAMVNFMARLENIPVTPGDMAARVIINSRTGSVVLTNRVSLRPAAVAHGNLSIVIDNTFQVSQPAPFSEGETVVIPDTDISIEQQPGILQHVEGADLAEVVKALNALGATTQDLMSILEALKAAGSLRAEVEIL